MHHSQLNDFLSNARFTLEAHPVTMRSSQDALGTWVTDDLIMYKHIARKTEDCVLSGNLVVKQFFDIYRCLFKHVCIAKCRVISF